MLKISLFHHFPNSESEELQEEFDKINAKLDAIKDQLNRIEGKLDNADEPLRQEIMDKLNIAIIDIEGTIP